MQTAERVSTDLSDNYVFQRSILAYYKAGEIISRWAEQHGSKPCVLEIGTGSGYGVQVIAPLCDIFTSIDKFNRNNAHLETQFSNLRLLTQTVPPFQGIADESMDFVVTFQVIEHIKQDAFFVKEIHRVLKKGGIAIIATPNRRMSLTRNPWHVREYSIEELRKLLAACFGKIEAKGVTGNGKIMEYYEKNREGVRKITRFDIFNLQYRLPACLLRIPYDILNRINRRRLLKGNVRLVSDISMEDYSLQEADETCFDLFFIVEKL